MNTRNERLWWVTARKGGEQWEGGNVWGRAVPLSEQGDLYASACHSEFIGQVW